VIYFAMLPTGVLNNANVVVYVILGEVPVYLFLSIYTLLLFFWYALGEPRHTTHTKRTIGSLDALRDSAAMMQGGAGTLGPEEEGRAERAQADEGDVPRCQRVPLRLPARARHHLHLARGQHLDDRRTLPLPPRAAS
jgi:hypothetical protein